MKEPEIHGLLILLHLMPTQRESSLILLRFSFDAFTLRDLRRGKTNVIKLSFYTGAPGVSIKDNVMQRWDANTLTC